MKLVLRGLKKSFKDKEVLKSVTYEFHSGEITGLLGRNGAGKTTLMSILYGDHKADAGTFTLVTDDGQEVPLQSGDVGMVFAENILPEFLTGYEFIKFFLDIHQTDGTMRVDDYLDFMAISEEDRHRLIKGYSDGMKSKLALLTIFISRPKVILLDEPLTAVDVVSSIVIKKFLLELRRDHILILSTHIMSLAEDLCDTVGVLEKGVLTPLDIGIEQADFEEKLLEVLSGGDDHV